MQKCICQVLLQVHIFVNKPVNHKIVYQLHVTFITLQSNYCFPFYYLSLRLSLCLCPQRVIFSTPPNCACHWLSIFSKAGDRASGVLVVHVEPLLDVFKNKLPICQLSSSGNQSDQLLLYRHCTSLQW